MINNIENLFLKYKLNINSKKDTEEKVINILEEKINIKILPKNIKIDQKNKTINIVNIASSLRFFLKEKIDQDIKEKIKSETGFNLCF